MPVRARRRARDRVGQRRVDQRERPGDPALGREVEGHLVAAGDDVLAQQRGDAVAAVVLGVGLVPAAEQAVVQHPQGRGEDPVAVEPGRTRSVSIAWRTFGRRRARVRTRACFSLVTGQPPLLVVEVLPPPGGVGADGLDVPVRIRADPDVLPRRRDDERRDPLRASRRPPGGRPRRRTTSPSHGGAGSAPAAAGHYGAASCHPSPVFRRSPVHLDPYPAQEGSSREAIISSATARSLRFLSWE